MRADTHRHLKRRASVFAALALLLVFGQALADPALWVVKSPMATVYLFGTIHVLPKGTQWHYPALDQALAASDALYVEADDASRARVMALILKYGVNDADRANHMNVFDGEGIYPHADYIWNRHALSRALDPTDKQRLRIAARRAELPLGVATLESMRPWLAALTLTVAATRKSGYEPQFGADTALERDFESQGKPVRSFETTHDQIAFFADTPPTLQMDLLRNVLEHHVMASAPVATLARDWLTGDVTAIAAAINDEMLKHYPGLYNALLVTRNRKWAGQIAGILKQPGTFFVAVGAGHLAGPDSVQAQLAKRGIATRRVH
jgi:uncharacterized protein YbaP (TraB family)